MISLKIGAIIIGAFVAGAFAASPELRAYAAATIGSAEIIDNSIQSVDIKDGQVKALDIAGSAVNSGKIKDGEVLNADLGPNAVTSAKIADGTIASADIAPNAVTADELAGVSKLIFSRCSIPSDSVHLPGTGTTFTCTVIGTDPDDQVIVSENVAGPCYAITRVNPLTDQISVTLVNVCSSGRAIGEASYSIIVFDR